MSYINIVETVNPHSDKTRRWNIMSTEFPHIKLGAVAWMGPWRKYAFYPETDTIFEEVCLADIAEFLLRATSEHRTERRALRAPPKVTHG